MTEKRSLEQKLRAKLDVIIVCFFLTSFALINLGVLIVMVLFGVHVGPGLQTWAGVSLIVAVVFGVIADITLLTDKVLLYRLFKRLNQPPK
jgi:hypothetical protein